MIPAASRINIVLKVRNIHFSQAAVNSNTELFGCCGCGCSVERVISLGLPKQGYVPGESIYVIGNLDNRDREEFSDFQASFVQARLSLVFI